MKKAQYNSVTKILPILFSCGLIVFAASSCKKNESERALEKPDVTIQTSDKTISDWASFFPDGLMDSDGVDVPLERLEGKLVGLYFSASWCAPCHLFSPHLIEFQDQYKEHFEVVLVGRDGVKEKQLEYMKEYDMPFPTTKWANGKNTQSNNLKDKYKATSIPRLVILSSEGQLVIDNAREAIQSTPEDVAELFTNKRKLDELVAANAKILAKQANEAQIELQNKIQTYTRALQEKFPPLDEGHKTTQIAHYTFDSTADDSLEESPAFTLENTTYEDGALNLNGHYFPRDGGYRASLSLADLLYTQFSIGQEFLIREHADVASKSTTIVVGGRSFRWFGLRCNQDGKIELFLNNGRFAHTLSGAEVSLNEWNRVLTSVDLYEGVVKIWFNGKLLPEVKIPEDFILDVIASQAIERDKNFHFTNHSTSETLDGLVDDVVIYDGSLSDTEIVQEAASFGSRWSN
ncbi:thiol-disulfide oxidoreductase [Novipirellula aureliae]|uniref:Thiol-disulfide oxidoreductase n=1 Tax=Novipirellula aureliae TaxID=2527966 RepID=A0A5C6EA70_9BACT|nr:thioredoxin-like domain-containing protein [Novipirellula aureliae]TWU44386.1 thiol-disulfide oxidoreductase [Novipirellula aureliae]